MTIETHPILLMKTHRKKESINWNICEYFKEVCKSFLYKYLRIIIVYCFIACINVNQVMIEPYDFIVDIKYNKIGPCCFNICHQVLWHSILQINYNFIIIFVKNSLKINKRTLVVLKRFLLSICKEFLRHFTY